MKTLNAIAAQIGKAQLAAEIAKATATAKCRVQLAWHASDYHRGTAAYAAAVLTGAETKDADAAAAQAIADFALELAGIAPLAITPHAKPVAEDTAALVARLVSEALKPATATATATAAAAVACNN